MAIAVQRALSPEVVCTAALGNAGQLLRGLSEMGLTKKRRIVLAFYTSDPTCTLEDALAKAGYSDKRAKITACELRKDPEFLAALERKQTQKLEKLEREELTDEQVIDGIRDIDTECQLAGPVAAFLALRLKAHELLCKVRGMFIEKIEVGFGAELAKEIAAARERAKLSALPTLVIEGGFTEVKEN
jgi:hypothetical protein